MGDSDYEYEYSEDDEEPSDDDYGFDPNAEVATQARKVPYVVFSEEQLRERQHEALSSVCNVLHISEGEAARILRHCKWDVNRVNEEWFSESNEIRGKVGLVDVEPSTSGSSNPMVECKICYDKFKQADMFSGKCRHFFCKDCWEGYLTTAIADGPACLNLRCPLPDCKIAVPRDLVKKIVSPEDNAKYETFFLRSYVEDNRKLTWCPAPGCEHAVECMADISAGEPLDIACKCGAAFCFNCKEEAHRPVECEMVKQWLVKNSAESENLNWILANTKPCPKCKRPIEKHQGCMHMTCSQCRFEFCWLCLGGWQEHGENTGGFYACNRYEAGKKKGEYSEEEQKRENARNSLERYMHYYQRWAEHDKVKKLATKKMQECTATQLEQLSNNISTPTSQLRFVVDAWAQVVNCRRILKWTYTFGFYRFGEGNEFSPQQQEFFEFNQGQAEMFLEKLNGVIEKKTPDFAKKPEPPSPSAPTSSTEPPERDLMAEWGKFREQLIGLTDVTHTHFEKLVSELEKGMEHMLNHYGGTQPVSMDVDKEEEEAGPSSAPEASGSNRRVNARVTSKRPRGAPQVASPELEMSSEDEDDLAVVEAAAGHWQCRDCTYANTDLTLQECSMCGHPRGAPASVE